MKVPSKITLLTIALLATPALAQETLLDIQTSVQKEETVVADDGREYRQLVPADKVVPGDEVVYTLAFRNVGDQPADNVVITNPLPAELTYVSGSAGGEGSAIQFSADGGATYAPPGALTINDENGPRPALPGDFTHIRWVVGRALAPGQGGEATFRARLN